MEKKISPKGLSKVLWRWYHGAVTCGTFTHLETMGYASAMSPALEELYPDKKELKEKLSIYDIFYNTEIFLGAIVLGINCALEEARANKRDNVDGVMINSLRTGLMGPLAAIGDSIIIGTYIPLVLGIAVGLSQGGSILGPLFYTVVWNVTLILFMKYVFSAGYNLGVNALEVVTGPKAQAIKDAITKVGLIVVGAISATWIGVNTSFQLKYSDGTPFLNLQGTLDNIFPKLLVLLLIILNWWLLAKKKVNTMVVMLLMFALTLIGVAVGFFDPGVTY